MGKKYLQMGVNYYMIVYIICFPSVKFIGILEKLTDVEREAFFTILRLIGAKMANSSFRSSPPLTVEEMIEGFPDNIQPVAKTVIGFMEGWRILLRTPGSNPPTFRIDPNRATDILDLLPKA
jgi:hypothetical protein